MVHRAMFLINISDIDEFINILISSSPLSGFWKLDSHEHRSVSRITLFWKHDLKKRCHRGLPTTAGDKPVFSIFIPLTEQTWIKLNLNGPEISTGVLASQLSSASISVSSCVSLFMSLPCLSPCGHSAAALWIQGERIGQLVPAVPINSFSLRNYS